MKNMLCFLFLFSELIAQGDNFKPISECENFNTFVNSTNISNILPLADTISSNGIIIFNYHCQVEPEFLENNLNWFNLDTNFTFERIYSEIDPFNPNIIYERYQEYFKNVKVSGGGYSIKIRNGPEDPCQSLLILSPYLLTIPTFSVLPNVSYENAIQIILDSLDPNSEVNLQVDTPELSITYNHLNSCNFALSWEAKSFLPNGPISENLRLNYINAINGSFYKSIFLEAELVAPTQIYFDQQLLDFTQSNGATILTSPNQKNNFLLFSFWM